ncbi:MAG: GntR family transcriptional regulator [Lacunisphaera sp.]|nr:GntR family transcriptional regulator [Lacunisphaera sp.]
MFSGKISLVGHFTRASIADQASVILREAVMRGEFGEFMPGEHQLAKQLAIGRISLRTAIRKLCAEGLMIRRKGCRTRVTHFAGTDLTRDLPTICMIYPFSPKNMRFGDLPILGVMRELCTAKGIRWDEIHDVGLEVGAPKRQLRDFAYQQKNICWGLLSCSTAAQHWFAQSKLPAFSLGSTPTGLKLLSIDTDHHAVGWHAAGMMVKYGHQQIGLLLDRHPLPGDLSAHLGFLDYIAKSLNRTKITIIQVDTELSGFNSRFQLDKSHKRPTALFCNRLPLALRAMFNLLETGVRIPQDISFVVGDSHSLIDLASLGITRYRRNHARLAKCAVRIAEGLLHGHDVGLEPRRLISTFVLGNTLGAPPSRA